MEHALLLNPFCSARGHLTVSGMTVTHGWDLLGNGQLVLSHYCKQELETLTGISVLTDSEMHPVPYVAREPLGKHLLTV